VEKGWSVGGQRSGMSMEKWVDGIVVPVTKSFLLYTFFPFWGRDADGGREVFLSYLSSQSTWGVSFFPPFFAFFTFLFAFFSCWSLPSLMIQIGLSLFFIFPWTSF
jgi:hypothetical protein